MRQGLNHSEIPGWRRRKASRALEMAVFDALPPGLRDFLNVSPLKFSSVAVKEKIEAGRSLRASLASLRRSEASLLARAASMQRAA